MSLRLPQDDVDRMVSESLQNAIDNGHYVASWTVEKTVRELMAYDADVQKVDEGQVGLAVAKWKGLL